MYRKRIQIKNSYLTITTHDLLGFVYIKANRIAAALVIAVSVEAVRTQGVSLKPHRPYGTGKARAMSHGTYDAKGAPSLN